eukprot:CAMPEP_0172501592 /NCGR_PEP_ID=MMETSP1066-20121228/151267_1 /TAXON_ID=671091 /ORGANISM="Coscinodiscus wailesii, Strain CCMP2513" /LENGTH=453 /DNA_ID=CAMNT_0013276461 /DNA_START=153 /DNA_END=1511 /DNA_ORIENTATION=+
MSQTTVASISFSRSHNDDNNNNTMRRKLLPLIVLFLSSPYRTTCFSPIRHNQRSVIDHHRHHRFVTSWSRNHHYNDSQHRHQLTLPHRQQRHPPSSSLPSPTKLFSSTTPNEDTTANSNNNNPNQRRKNLFQKTARSFVQRITTFKSRFLRLSKRARAIVIAQLTILALIVGGLVRTGIVRNGGDARAKPVEVPFSVFMDLAEASASGSHSGVAKILLKKDSAVGVKLDNVIIGRDKISFRTTATSTDPPLTREAYTRKVSASPGLVDFLRQNAIPFRAASTKSEKSVAATARLLFFGVYLLFLIRLYQNVSGGSGGGGNIPGKLANSGTGADRPLVKFDDIEGIDKAKFEVMELVDTLRNPTKYAILGARAPKGLLLVGPPGTGKTMLARATAATAGVPLLYCSGSDFVEMFVGRGAARVRKTFQRAGKLAPCIVFIDELDALGKSRDSGLG